MDSIDELLSASQRKLKAEQEADFVSRNKKLFVFIFFALVILAFGTSVYFIYGMNKIDTIQKAMFED